MANPELRKGGRKKPRQVRKQKAAPPKAICGGVKRKGEGLCERPPGAGTDHLGVGRCSLHGGNAPAGIRAAGAQIHSHLTRHRGMLDDAPVLGTPVENPNPTDLLLGALAIIAGQVRYLQSRLFELDPDDLFGPQRTVRRRDAGAEGGFTETLEGPPEFHILWREYDAKVLAQAHLSKMAFDAKIDERLVALAEGQSLFFAEMFRRVFG